MNSITVARSIFGKRQHMLAEGGESASLLHRTGIKLESAAIAVGVTASVLAIFVPLDFVHMASMFKQTATSAGTSITTDDAMANKPTEHDSSMGYQTCNTTPAGAGQEFSKCASFVLDYTKAADGQPRKTYLNIFSGRPQTNDEAQIYTGNKNNLRIENGSLVLEARQNTDTGARYTSARVDTKHKADFLYGRLVIRAKMPAGIGTWPAIWMLPSESKYAQLSAPSDTAHLSDGEIDIAESIGLQPNVVYGVAHSLRYKNDGVDHTFFNTVTIPGNDTSYHDYELNWTPTKITFKVDGAAFYSYDKPANADYRSWPYDQPVYLIINLAMGGSWGGQDRKHFPVDGVDPSALPASLRIQSVHYYPYVGQK
jgi:beta-glucanase (GH16 family)